jgi:hypothetical protein
VPRQELERDNRGLPKKTRSRPIDHEATEPQEEHFLRWEDGIPNNAVNSLFLGRQPRIRREDLPVKPGPENKARAIQSDPVGAETSSKTTATVQ